MPTSTAHGRSAEALQPAAVEIPNDKNEDLSAYRWSGGYQRAALRNGSGGPTGEERWSWVKRRQHGLDGAVLWSGGRAAVITMLPAAKAEIRCYLEPAADLDHATVNKRHEHVSASRLKRFRARNVDGVMALYRSSMTIMA